MELLHWVALVIILIVGFILAALFLTGILDQGFSTALSNLALPT